MTQAFPFFLGDGQRRASTINELPAPALAPLQNPEQYLAEPGLRDACNVALLLGQPLLLTGEPGTGKTRFADSLAWELGLEEPLRFEVKSTSTARSLFYTYDTLQRFQDIQSSASPLGAADPARYLRIQALGQAILNSQPPAELPEALAGLAREGAPKRSVVLIDEMDKAPRDFPNDLLNELEHLFFRIPELGDLQLRAREGLRPVVVITSNSEKDLPDAFLRRCVYHHLAFPDPERLREIVARQLQGWPCGSVAMADAIDLFYRLREPRSGLRKKPATAELLGWLLTLPHVLGGDGGPISLAESGGLRGQEQSLRRSFSSLIKTADDKAKAERVLSEWITQPQA
jgi:MoxR-like ATPase